jgi:hypothetical protein
MSALTVALPHRRNDGNDKALAICLDCLMRNTRNNFKLIMDAAYDEPLYERVNRMVRQADTEIVVYLASDTFLAPNWDVPMLELYTPDTFVTGVLVEPGVIGIHPDNVPRDFGRKPETFRRAEFEAWCVSSDAYMPDHFGWYCPYMFNRDGWLAFGGYQSGLDGDHHGFTGADTLLFELWRQAGNHVKRARSFAYHLQRWSQVDEQEAEKRNE